MDGRLHRAEGRRRPQVGYVGEAFVLEATRLGLGTCWVAGMFDRKNAAGLVKLHRGEHVIAVSPVGHPVERKEFVERMMSKAVRSAARRQVEEIAPGLTRGSGQARLHGPAGAAWPAWAVAAVEAARVAPSGANRQPWRFRMQDGALVMGRAEKTYWTAPIDFGIAMLHVELGAAHEGIRGAWEHLPEPGRDALRAGRRLRVAAAGHRGRRQTGRSHGARHERAPRWAAKRRVCGRPGDRRSRAAVATCPPLAAAAYFSGRDERENLTRIACPADTVNVMSPFLHVV